MARKNPIVPTRVHNPDWPYDASTYRNKGCRCDRCRADYTADSHVKAQQRRRMGNVSPTIMIRRLAGHRPLIKLPTDSWPGRP